MVQLVPVDREKHAGKKWRRPNGYGFAAKDNVAPLSGSEITSAALAMPLAFVEQAGRFVLVGVVGMGQENFFVGPDDRWLGGYVPAALRSYPFALGRLEGTEQLILCIDQDSGLIVDEDAEGAEPFFDSDGKQAAILGTATQVLVESEQARMVTDLAIAALADAGVIKPWPLSLSIGTQQMAIKGLFRIDEGVLNALNDETFLKLRKTSALIIAYGQLFSTGQVNMLARAGSIRQRVSEIGLTPPAAG